MIETKEPIDQSDYRKAAEKVNESLIVCAAAGTGKTTVLVNRYLQILEAKNSGIDQIIAITFTEKAANEMKDRIRSELKNPSRTFTDSDRGDLIDKVNTALISTVHAFCGRILHDNIFLLDIDPLFRISDEVEESLQRADYIERFLNDRLKANHEELMNFLDVMELSQIKDLLNVVWKKRSECLDQLFIIRTTSSENLLKSFKKHYSDLTFQNLRKMFNHPEVRTILDRIRNLSCSDHTDTLQRAFDQILTADEELSIGKIPANFSSSELKDAFSGTKKGTKDNWGQQIEEARGYREILIRHWKSIKEEFYSFDEEEEKRQIQILKAFSFVADEFITSYRNEIFSASRLDFGSLETETVRLLSGKTEEIKKYIGRFKHLLVDEFQDINPIQHRIIDLIQELNPGIVTFFVGDEKQSIYRFRGAEVEIFNRLKQHKIPLRLDKNYRSVTRLMDFYNTVFTQILGVEDPDESFEVNYPIFIEPIFGERQNFPQVELLVVKDNSENEAAEAESEEELASTDSFTSELSEATFVVNKIRDLVGKPIVKVKDKPLRPAKFGDMVILLRSRTHQIEFESTFQKAGIPYYVASGIGFYERQEVQDIVNFLRLLLNFNDEVALIAVLRSPMFGISDYTLLKMTTEKGLVDGLKCHFFRQGQKIFVLDDDECQKLERFFTIYMALSEELSKASTAGVIREIVSQTNYLPILASMVDGPQRIVNVQKLCGLALEWSSPNYISPIDFIRRIEIYRTMEVREGEANLSSERGDSVTIMTIHASKGLDFPIVFIPFLSSKFKNNTDRLVFYPKEGIALSMKTPFSNSESFMFKYLKKRESARAIAEEKRLFYVAATRAQSYLILSADETARKKKNIKQSTWGIIKPAIDAVGKNDLYVKIEKTVSDLYNDYRQFNPSSSIQENTLIFNLPGDLKNMIRPIKILAKPEKVTPTQFAKYIAEKFMHLSHQPLIDYRPEKNILTPMEMGMVIHQVFQWWDFQDLAAFRKKANETLKPFLLSDREQRFIEIQLSEWADYLLQPDNPLRNLLDSAYQIQREVEIYGYLSDVLIEGKIDLLIRNSAGEYVIVDFKSDYINEKPNEQLEKKYRTQLDLYALVLVRWSDLPVRNHCIYFIRNGSMIDTTIDEQLLDMTMKELSQYLESLQGQLF